MLTIKSYFDLIMPEVKLSKEKDMLGDFVRVKKNDSDLRIAMHTIAKYFMREFQNDSVLFPHPKFPSYDEKECHGYLLTIEKSGVEMKSIAVGGFCFRRRDFGYGMQWIWLHPYVRNKGLLSRHWALLEDKFGKDFYCEPPYSHEMKSFLNKNKSESHTKHDNLKSIPMGYNKL